MRPPHATHVPAETVFFGLIDGLLVHRTGIRGRRITRGGVTAAPRPHRRPGRRVRGNRRPVQLSATVGHQREETVAQQAGDRQRNRQLAGGGQRQPDVLEPQHRGEPRRLEFPLAGGFTNSTGMSGDKFSTLTYFWTLAMQQGMVWIGSGMKPAIADDTAAPRESLNYIGGYGGAMATNPFDNPQDMSPADLATAPAFGQRFATFLTAGKTANTPYIDFTTN
jgi:hypothetical protein